MKIENNRAVVEQLRSSERRLQGAKQKILSLEHQLSAAHQQLAAAEEQLASAQEDSTGPREIIRGKRVEEAQRKSGLMYEDFYENAPDMFVSVDAATGTILECNETTAAKLSYEKGEIIGRDVIEMYHSDSEEERKKVFARFVETGEVHDAELQLRRKDGSKLDVSLSVSAVRDDEGKILYSRSVWRDITERKEAEAALRESEEKFRNLAEQSPNMVFINKQGKIEYANKKCQEIMGYQREEFYSSDFNFLTLIAPESHDSVKISSNKHMQGKEVSAFEFTLITKGGARIEAIYSSKLIKYSGESAVLGTVTDITEQKRSESALRESEATARALLNTPDDVAVLLDAEGIILDINEAISQRFGKDVKELVGVYGWDLLAQDIGECRKAYFNEVIHSGKLVRFEDERQGKWFDNIFYPVIDEQGKVIKVAIKARDITERKRAEAALQESEERYRDLFENAVIGMYRTTPDGRILMANPTLVRMLGYTSFEELTRRNLEEQGFEPQFPRFLFKEQIESEGQVKGLESAWKKSDGTTLFIRENAVAVHDQEGKTLYYEGSVEDITQRKEAEQKLRESEERYRTIFEGSRDAIFIVGEDACFAEVNEAAVNLTGYSREELLQMIIPDLHAEEDTEAFKQYFHRIMSGEQITSEAKILRKDGIKVDTEFSNRRIMFGETAYMQTVARDITERKQAEDELKNRERLYREQQAFLSGVYNGVDSAIFVIEVTQDGDFRYQHNNLAYQKSSGLSLEDFKGKRPEDLSPYVPEEVIKKVRANYQRCLRAGKTIEYEEHITMGEKEFSLITRLTPLKDEEGRIYQIIGTSTDITERKRAEAALRESEERFRRLSEAAFEAISIHDEGVLLSANGQFFKMFGFEPDELLGKQVIPLLVAPEAREFMSKQIASGGLGPYESIGLRKDGSRFPMEIQVRLMEYEGRKVRVGALVDITERRRAEESAAKEHERLLAVFAALPDFVYVKASDHSIRFTNQAFRDLFGEPAGRRCYELFRGRQDPCADCPKYEVFETRKPLHREWTSKEGRTYMAHDVPLSDPDGTPLVLEIGIDITERKQADQALRESEERFRVLFNHVFDAIVMIDEAGRISDVNEAACRLLGYSKDELLKLGAEDIHPAEEMEKIRRAVERVLQSGIDSMGETAFLSRQGQTIAVEAGGVTAKIADKTYILGSFRDITERKRAEKLMHIQHDLARALTSVSRLEEGLRLSLDAALEASEMDGGGIYLVDKNTGALDLVIHQGLPSDFVKSVSHYEAEAANTQLIMAGEPVYTQYKNLGVPLSKVEQRSGLRGIAVLPIRHEDQVIGCLNVASYTQEEVSDFDREELEAIAAQIGSAIARLQAEQALRESEARYKRLVENSPDIIWSFSDKRGTIYASARVNEILGYPPEFLYQNPWLWNQSIHPDDQDLVDRVITDFAAAQPVDVEYRIKDSVGNWHWFHDRSIGRRQQGEETIMEGISIDITVQKRVEEESRLRQRELAHAARLSTVGEMASELAHELNQPLTAISAFAGGSLRMLQSGAGVTDEITTALQKVSDQSQRAGEIIRRIRDFTRKQVPQRSKINLNNITREAVCLIEPEAGNKKVEIRLKTAQKIPSVMADAIQIEQVVLNLLRNGLEAMDDAALKKRCLTVKICPMKNKNAVEVAVSDTGVGINPENIEKIFESFYTTKDKGLGIGLSLSRSIIESHGGHLWGENNAKGGATFRFTLPVAVGKT